MLLVLFLCLLRLEIHRQICFSFLTSSYFYVLFYSVSTVLSIISLTECNSSAIQKVPI